MKKIMNKENEKKSKVKTIVLWITLSLVGLILLSTVINLILTHTEMREIDYGEKIEIDGGTMNVETYGSGEDVIVILPGSGNASPAMDFKYLAGLMSENHTVVIPEPFGYGLSDITDKERTFTNIANEIHECLSKLGYKSYTLMGHSLSGMTMLEYANLYPEEVNAVIALDTSVPKQLSAYTEFTKLFQSIAERLFRFLRVTGGVRIYYEFGERLGILQTTMTNEEWEMFKHISYDRHYNKNIIEEIDNFMNTEAPRMQDMTYPDSIPVLTFLSGDSAAPFSEWEQWHRDLTSNEASSLEIMSGGHYVYYFHAEEIAEKAIALIRDIQ